MMVHTSYYYAALKNFVAVPFYTLTLKTPDGATVVLKDRSGAEITGKNGAYTVAAGTYAYTVSKFGYETETGSITVNADVNKTVTLSELASCTLTFAVTPAENAKVTVTHPVGGTIKPETDGGYKLYLGETYAYTVTKAEYIPVHGSITAAEDKTLSFTLTYAGEGWDGTAKTAPTQDKNGVYQIGTAAELAWFADAVNKGDTTISGKLTANINLNGKPWTAIGTSSNKFAGTLDGDSHTVSGLAGTGGLCALYREGQRPLRYDRRRLRPSLRRVASDRGRHLHQGRRQPPDLLHLRRRGGKACSRDGTQVRRVDGDQGGHLHRKRYQHP